MVQIVCSICNKPILKENKVRYTGAFGYRKQCKPCLAKQSEKYNKKKSKALKLYRSFWT